MGFFNRSIKKDNAQQPNSSNIQTLNPNQTERISSTESSGQFEAYGEVIPVEVRIKSAFKSKQGLFPHEILVLDYAHTFYTTGNSFQGFWWYKYGVRDVQIILKSLESRGFLQIGDISSSIILENVSVLKEVLRLHELKLTGNKDLIVQRLLDSFPEKELSELFPKRTYALTEYGKEALHEGEYIRYIHRHMVENLDIWSLNRMIYTQPYRSFRDKIWEFLNVQSIKHFRESNFGLYRNCRFCMSHFLFEESRYRDSLAFLAEVVFIDLSGVQNNYDPEFLNIMAPYFFPYKDSSITSAPAIISSIFNCQKELSYSEEDIKGALTDEMQKLHLPLQIFTVEECVRIVFLERDQNTDALAKIYEKAKLEFKKNYPNISLKKN